VIFDADDWRIFTVVVLSNCYAVINARSPIIRNVLGPTTLPNARKRTKFGCVCMSYERIFIYIV